MIVFFFVLFFHVFSIKTNSFFHLYYFLCLLRNKSLQCFCGAYENSFSPTDSKFVSCSDDGTLRIWDFLRCQEERVLRGHGADVKCVHWHPQKGIIVSGSKDNQQPIKLWDPKSGSALATLHAHKSTVMDLKWNDNGNWLVTASRDHLLKLFDLRNLREEMQVFRGHKKEASSVAWHPVHEGLFCSGGSDGSILFWNVGTDKEIGCVETAHDSIVWTLAWHPLGHILCSGSNDHTIKFWTRNRPGDLMRDKYNLNTLPASLAALDDCEYDDAIIPGMGPEDKVEFTESLTADKGFIPGLDLDGSKMSDRDKEKKVPYSKPIPRNFQAQWAGSRRGDDDMDMQLPMLREIKEETSDSIQQTSENAIEGMLASGVLTTMDPQTIVGILIYQRFIRVHQDSRLMIAVRQGPEYMNKYIDAGKLEELRDIVPLRERSRSMSPVFEARDKPGSPNPPSKKSRFEPRQHHAQVVTVRELLSLKKPFMPCLLSMKQQQPEAPRESDSGGAPVLTPLLGKMQQGPPPLLGTNNRPSPWAMGGPQGPGNFPNQSMPPSLWANGPPPLGGFPMGKNGFSGNNSNNPFSGPPPSSFNGGGGGGVGGGNGDNYNNFGNRNNDDRDIFPNNDQNSHNNNNNNNNMRRNRNNNSQRSRGRMGNRRF